MDRGGGVGDSHVLTKGIEHPVSELCIKIGKSLHVLR